MSRYEVVIQQTGRWFGWHWSVVVHPTGEANGPRMPWSQAGHRETRRAARRSARRFIEADRRRQTSKREAWSE